ncbi:MAG: MotA/TolQ/ExbB proton channel family protein [Bacteroidota bacterium]
MRIFELHQEGGVPFMIPIDLGLIALITVLILLISKRASGKSLPDHWLNALRHIGGWSLVAGVFGTLAGLFQAFGALEEIKEGLPFYMIAGGMKVALINVLYGCLVYILALTAYIILNVTEKRG